MTISDIYSAIGQTIVDSIDSVWDKAILNIENIGSIGLNLSYLESNTEKSSKINGAFILSRRIKKLHEITTEGGKNKWNKAIFTLTPDGEFDMEFIWDQELQNEVESFS